MIRPSLARIFALWFLAAAPIAPAARAQGAPPDRWTTARQIRYLHNKKSALRPGAGRFPIAQPLRAIGEQGPGPFRFAVLGDSRPEGKWFLKFFYPPETSERVFRTFLDRMAALGLDFSLHTGDLVNRGTAEEYLAFFGLLDQKVSWPFFTVIGNHELTNTPEGKSEAEFERALGPANYYFDFRGFRFIAVDTSRCLLTAKDLAWLKETLDTPLRKIVFTHVPPKQIVQWVDVLPLYGIGLSRGSRAFTDLMTQFHVERVYLGHLHGFGVLDYGGVRYVLTAGAGAPFRPWLPVHRKIYNFVLVDVDFTGRLSETVYFLDMAGRLQSRPMAEYPPTEKL